MRSRPTAAAQAALFVPYNQVATEPTLSELRDEVEAVLAVQEPQPHMYCRACGQRVQLYKRRLHNRMAEQLVRAYLHQRTIAGRGQWWRFTDARLEQNGEYSKLAIWGLLEENDGERGEWRVTDLGWDFVEGRAIVPRAVFVYNGTCRGVSPELIGRRDVLGAEFDLEAVLAGREG